MVRITISINGAAIEQDLVTLDLDLSLTLADLKSLVEVDTNVQAAKQDYFLDGQALKDNTKSLQDLGIKDGEMLFMVVNGGQNASSSSQQQRQPARRTRQQPASDDPARIESIRQQLLNNPTQMTSLIDTAPDLAQVIDNPTQFREAWLARIANDTRERQNHENEIRRLNEDPFNADSQKRIADMIRRENIEKNLQYALENNPAVFGNVSMLYIPVLVNGYPVKAFVDSGAQTTIMSPSCAEACGLDSLIDERFSGIAKGVGTAKILGRVHHAKIQVGDAELDCAFTVMEGKDVDLLFGLDMLRRHQACIDLETNKLRFQHTSVDFLPESELPKREEARILDEPTVPGPDGTEIGARTGTVRPQGTSEAVHEAVEKAKAAADQAAKPPSAGGLAGASTEAPSAPGRSAQYSEEGIAQLVALGFNRDEAIQALDATGGDVEYAAGLLFGR